MVNEYLPAIAVGLLAGSFVSSQISHAGTLECRPLEPNKPIIKEIEDYLRLEGKVLRKIIGSGELANKYRSIETDILSQYPNADHLHIWKSFIYLACTSLSNSQMADEDKLKYIDALISDYHRQTYATLQRTFETGTTDEKLQQLDTAINSKDPRESAVAVQLALRSSDEYLQIQALHHLVKAAKTLSGTWTSEAADIKGVFGFEITNMDVVGNVVNFTGQFTGSSLYMTARGKPASGSLSGKRLRVSSNACALSAEYGDEGAFIGDMTCHFYYEKGRYNGTARVQIPVY